MNLISESPKSKADYRTMGQTFRLARLICADFCALFIVYFSHAVFMIYSSTSEYCYQKKLDNKNRNGNKGYQLKLFELISVY